MIKCLLLSVLLLSGTIGAAGAQTPETPTTPPTPMAPAAGTPAALPGVEPTLSNVMKAMVRLGAIDLSDDRVLDDYARAVYCDIYQRYHDDEFTWRKVRAAMRTSIKLHINEYPLTFMLDRPEKIGQYDFSLGVLPLAGESVMNRTIFISLYDVGDTESICGAAKFNLLPTRYVAVLDKPLQFNSIPMSESRAANVVKYFDAASSPTGGERQGYGRFIVTLTSFKKLNHFSTPPEIENGAHLDDIQMYIDPNYQERFWSGKANFTGRKVSGPTPLDQIPFEGITGTPQQ